MGTEAFIGQINTFAFGFPPRGWMACNGQTLSISQNTALFSLIGTYYGGNGTSTFALPNLQGRVPVHQGNLAGGQSYTLGEVAGTESVTLTTTQMPQHTHQFTTFDTRATLKEPAAGCYLGRATDGSSVGSTPQIYVPTGTNTAPVALNGTSISPTGGSQPHENRQPFLVLNMCICTSGVFPSRN